MTASLALFLSLVVEAAIAASVVAIDGRGRPEAAALAAVVGTMTTHGFAWNGVLVATDHVDWITAVLAVETLVVIVEAFVYRAMTELSPARSLAISALANTASTLFGVGLWLLGFE